MSKNCRKCLPLMSMVLKLSSLLVLLVLTCGLRSFPPTWDMIYQQWVSLATRNQQWHYIPGMSLSCDGRPVILLITDQYCFPMVGKRSLSKGRDMKSWQKWRHFNMKPDHISQRNCLACLAPWNFGLYFFLELSKFSSLSYLKYSDIT